MTIDPFATSRNIDSMLRDMTLKKACEQLQDMTRQRHDGLVEFPRRYYPNGVPQPVSDLETKLLDNGIIRFARQEFDRRVYHVVDKALASVLEVNT